MVHQLLMVQAVKLLILVLLLLMLMLIHLKRMRYKVLHYLLQQNQV
jgi:hypothetical protein